MNASVILANDSQQRWQDVLSDTIDLIRPSVVQFAVSSKDRKQTGVFGSGVIVDKNGHVATCAHVVRDAAKYASEGLDVRIGLAMPNIENEPLGNVQSFSMRASFYMTRATHVANDDVKDLAVVKMEPNPFVQRPVIMQLSETAKIEPMYQASVTDTTRPKDGTRIAASGYPLHSPNMVTTSGAIASAWESQKFQVQDMTTGEILEVSEDFYLGDMTVNPGNSGGPVYSVPDGHVIGIVSAFRFAPIFFRDKAEEVAVDNRPIGLNSGLAVVAPIGGALEMIPSA